MISIRVTTQDATGFQDSYTTQVNGTIQDAREYFLNKVMVNEVYDYDKFCHCEVKTIVVAVDLITPSKVEGITSK